MDCLHHMEVVVLDDDILAKDTVLAALGKQARISKIMAQGLIPKAFIV